MTRVPGNIFLPLCPTGKASSVMCVQECSGGDRCASALRMAAHNVKSCVCNKERTRDRRPGAHSQHGCPRTCAAHVTGLRLYGGMAAAMFVTGTVLNSASWLGQVCVGEKSGRGWGDNDSCAGIGGDTEIVNYSVIVI